MFCPYCGNELIENTAFCIKCGAKQPVIPALPQADDAGAAGSYGNNAIVPETQKLPQTDDAGTAGSYGNNAMTPGTQKLPQALSVREGSHELAPYDDTVKYPAPYKPKKKFPKKAFIYAALIILVLAAAGITAGILLHKKGSDKKEAANWSEVPKGKHISASELPLSPQLYCVLAGVKSVEYDSRAVLDGGSDILGLIMKKNGVADFSLYPVEAPVERNTVESAPMDPWGRAAAFGKYIEYKEDSVRWIAGNIFNAGDKEIDSLTDTSNSKTGSVMGYYSVNGSYYCISGNDTGSTGAADVLIGDVMYDGRFYYINYRIAMDDLRDGENKNDIDGYAVMELKEVEDGKYWSFYYIDDEIPSRLTASDYVSVKDIIAENCMKYAAKSGGSGSRPSSYTVSEEWRSDIGIYWLVQIYEGSKDSVDQKTVAYYFVHKDCTVYDWWDMSDEPQNIPVFVNK